MGDLSRRVSARGTVSLVPGMIYEWTPEGTSLVEVEGTTSSVLLKPGVEVVAGYRLVERIGEGCTGEVWRAYGPGGVAVALKTIDANRPGAAEELQSLALMLEVRHANLVSIFGIWEHDSWTAIGMDLADGSLLDRFESSLGFDELTDFLRQAARGIDFLNEPRHSLAGSDPVALIHRDIKPQNLLLVGGSVKVGDFGLVKQLDVADLSYSEVNDEPESLATVYSAPEVRRSELSSRSDQYSLAATYCQLRGGRAPEQIHGDENLDLSMLPCSERPPVVRAMAINPEDRWANCSEFVEALVSSVKEPTNRLQPAFSISQRVPARHPSVNRLRRLAIVVVILIFGASATTALNRSDKPAIPTDPSGPRVASPPVPNPPNAVPTSHPAVATPPMVVAVPPVAAETDSLVASPSTQAPEPGPVPDPPQPSPMIDPLGQGVLETPQPIVTEIETKREPEISALDLVLGMVAWANSTRGHLASRIESVVSSVQDRVKALPRPSPASARIQIPAEPPAPKTATITVRMPSSKAELVVRGEVGRGNPDEWYGPRRVIHTPPMTLTQDYLIGAFWTSPDGQPTTRSLPLKVAPGSLYEVDLRADKPTAVEVPRTQSP